MDVPLTLPFDGLADAVAWLDSHVDLESNMPRRRDVPTLDRMRALTSLLGEPQESIPSIHVTGTNGKGSTTAMATSLLLAKGLTVGTYTSPNLHDVAERLAHNGEPIDEESLTTSSLSWPCSNHCCPSARAASSCSPRPPSPGSPPRRSTPWWSKWVSGGTWDGTNVVHGDVAVLTNVSFDHTDVLGPTLEGIATDKAGIIEPGSRVVVGEMAPDLADIVTGRAREVGAESVWLAGRDFGCESNQVAVGGRVVTLWTPGGRYEDLLVPLHGAHQGVNASVALAAVEAFFGDPLDAEVVEEGLAAVRVPGRLEVLGRRPLLLVDGAHNAAGMAALADALEEEFAVDGVSVAVVGMLSGRDPSAMLAPLASVGIAAAVACEPDSPRAMPVAAVSEAGRALGLTVYEERDVSDALRVARGMVDADGLVVVAGSLYVVGTARADVLAAVRSMGGSRPLRAVRPVLGGCVVSTVRGPHPCHCEARRRRAGPGRRGGQPSRAQEAAPGGRRAADHHQGDRTRTTTPSMPSGPSSTTWSPSSPDRLRSSWSSKARRTPTPWCG